MKITYRPEIDGLRAIAVLAVICFHSQVTIFNHKPFNGGFIGVDIFFVISGYLITSIILKELVTTGSFSFKYFYERRIRRILPALLFVMLVSLPFSWIYIMPSYLIDFSKSVLYSLGFTSNFYFFFSDQQYNATSGLFKPFLHTWSLSVEEQYYVLFPISLYITFKYFKKYLIHTLIAEFLISLILAHWTSSNYFLISFYFIHTRMWELLAGSILAYFEIVKGYRCNQKYLNSILPTIGLFLIIASIFFFKENFSKGHPSFYTLPPIIGVCLIIWFSNKDGLITKILSTKLFVSIGLISYSLYLWHYPIFAFIKINGLAMGSVLIKLLLALTLLILSVLSYYFIERPCRNKKLNLNRVVIFLIILLIPLLVFNSLVIKKNGFKNRYKYLEKINLNYNPDNIFLGKMSMKKSNTNLNEFDTKDFNVIIIGDSHAGDLFNALNLNRILFKGVSFYYLNDVFNKGLFESEEVIKKSNIIIISYRWDDNKFKLLEDNFIKIKNLNQNLFITSRTNEYKVKSKLYTLIDYKVFFEKNFFDYFGLKSLYFNNRVIHSSSYINEKIKKFALERKAIFLNKEDFMCNIKKKECDYVTEDGYKIFYDYGHYTEHGAKYFGTKIHETNWLKIRK